MLCIIEITGINAPMPTGASPILHFAIPHPFSVRQIKGWGKKSGGVWQNAKSGMPTSMLVLFLQKYGGMFMYTCTNYSSKLFIKIM